MASAYGSPASRRSASWVRARARSGWFSTRSAWNAASATVRAGASALFARPAASSSIAVGEGGTWAQAQSAATRTKTRRRIRWLSGRGSSARRSLLRRVAGGGRLGTYGERLLVARRLALRGSLGNRLRLRGGGRFSEHQRFGQVRGFSPDLVTHLTEGALPIDAAEGGRGGCSEAVAPVGAQVQRLAHRALVDVRPHEGLELACPVHLQLHVRRPAGRAGGAEHRPAALAERPLERDWLADAGDDDRHVPSGAPQEHQRGLGLAAHAEQLLADAAEERRRW